MIQQRSAVKNIESLMNQLESKDGETRQAARGLLVDIGKPAVLSLNDALQNSDKEQVRWEAAKALGDIDDTAVIDPLIKVLGDSDADVAWLAAEGLKKFKIKAWPSLLNKLIKNGADSGILRHGVHHVLLGQKEYGYSDLLETLTKALDSSTLPSQGLEAANAILKKMKEKSE